ncbi:hypothetical protein [Streptomyces sp. ST2-7A]|uniref:DUF7736 domain-containing protein n=1 Tax=Streptomyces sp. ST2-7A TaxID=2907214 RepID=UPI001F3F8B72|nr:hypothetical protein [Streptomyces sp. ST2-7A]MCE7081181.1 hypothetical protein [Streptomyces sp. ST2-7A]
MNTPTQSEDMPLADVLSITTGRLLSHDHMGGVYRILGHMTGQDLMTHQLPRATDACAPALLEQHPQLASVTPPETTDTADLYAWLLATEKEHGTTVPVLPLPPGVWEHRNPIEELCDRVGAERVVVLPTEEDRRDR